MESNILIVLGMHRSGTSLVANWLHKSGISMGTDLLAASPNNLLGHFEDLDFFLFQEKIMNDSCLAFHVGLTEKIRITENYHVEAQEIIQRKKHQQQWGWKDPRTCLFLDFWQELLKEEGLRPKYLIVYRSVEEVVTSLIKRDINRLRNRRNKFAALLNVKKYNRNIKTKQITYLNSWKRHYLDVKNFHDKNEGDCLVISPFQLVTDHKNIKCFLEENWKFSMKEIAIEDVYRKDLLSAKNEINNYSDPQISELDQHFRSQLFTKEAT